MAVSIKKLRKYFEVTRGFSDEMLKAIRKEMQKAERHEYVDSEGSVYANYQKALKAIDALLGYHGIEVLTVKARKTSCSYYYCNSGDSYGVTVLLRISGNQYQFQVGTWGDIAEKYLDDLE